MLFYLAKVTYFKIVNKIKIIRLVLVNFVLDKVTPKSLELSNTRVHYFYLKKTVRRLYINYVLLPQLKNLDLQKTSFTNWYQQLTKLNTNLWLRRTDKNNNQQYTHKLRELVYWVKQLLCTNFQLNPVETNSKKLSTNDDVLGLYVQE